MPHGADRDDYGERIAKLEEHIKRVGDLESRLERREIEIRALEKSQVRNDLVAVVVFIACGIILMGAFGDTFRPRPAGPQSTRAHQEGSR